MGKAFENTSWADILTWTGKLYQVNDSLTALIDNSNKPVISNMISDNIELIETIDSRVAVARENSLTMNDTEMVEYYNLSAKADKRLDICNSYMAELIKKGK